MALLIGDDSRAERICATQEKLYSDRANFNSLWQSVSERVLPNYSDFITTWSPGQRRTNRIFESTATLALEHFCAAMESMLCPASTRWHSLRPADPELQNDIAIQQYCDQITDILFRLRYAPSANFQSQVHECFAQIGAFGNGPMLVDDIVGFGLRYRALHLAETFGIENAAGVIDHVQRCYKLTARAAIDAVKRGMIDTLPDEIVKTAEKNPTKQYEFIHAVYPNDEYDPRAKDTAHMAFASCIVLKEKRLTVKESGYHTQPMLFPRYRVAPKETYGRGPGVDVLPDILMLQEMEKADIRQTQRAAEPPILLADDGALSDFSLRGNALNYNMMSPDGKPLAMPFQTGSNFQVLEDRLDQKRKLIERAFLVDIFSILTQQPEMTATEVLQRAQEKGQLLAPIIGRQQSELFGPCITREIDIAHRAGLLPPPPQKLQKRGSFEFDIVYESEIQVSQRRTKAAAISATLQQMAPLAEADPNAMKVINVQRTARLIADSNGAPADILNTDAEMDDQNAQAAAQQNMQNIATIAGPASEALKNLTQAQKASASATPGNI